MKVAVSYAKENGPIYNIYIYLHEYFTDDIAVKLGIRDVNI